MTPAVLHWSSGKDAAFALHKARREGRLDIRAILSTVNETHERVAIHGVRREVLAAQARALQLPLVEVPLPYRCTNETYLDRMHAALSKLAAEGIADHIFGDLFLADVRDWREAMLEPLGLRAHFPLWKSNTSVLAREMLGKGLGTYVVTLDPTRMPQELCGTAYDASLLAALPAHIDPCGENGEFHTLVWDSPDFSAPLCLERGETVVRDGFVYTDFILADVGPAIGSG